MILLAVFSAGCQTSKHTGSLPQARKSTPENAAAQAAKTPLQRATAYWGKTWRSDQTNVEAGINYARNLRAMGRKNEALAVFKRVSAQRGGNKTVAAEYGKALADAGKLSQAMNQLSAASTQAPSDWRLASAQGTVLDKMGRHKEARAHYSRALTLAPNEPSILSNLGLSQALDGDLANAETTLRKAVQNPRAGSRVWQNLALVLGLQGKFEQAERVQRSVLPGKQAVDNVKYLRRMMKQNSSWNAISAVDSQSEQQNSVSTEESGAQLVRKAH